MTAVHAKPTLAEQRSALRSDITLAARVLPTHYPLETFIAVNPLAGFEALPFEQAVRRAGDLYGIRGTLSEERFRDLHRSGRITDADLDTALARRYPRPACGTAVCGSATVTSRQPICSALICCTATALRNRAPPPQPRRALRSRGRPDRRRADRQVVRGILRRGQPGRCRVARTASTPPGERWHAADPTLPRKVQGRASRSVAERPDDAILQALSALGVDETARIAYLQAHLTRLPGWAAHIQWCAGRDAGIDLPGYLAMRLSYEAALLPEDRDRAGAEPAGAAGSLGPRTRGTPRAGVGRRRGRRGRAGHGRPDSDRAAR